MTLNAWIILTSWVGFLCTTRENSDQLSEQARRYILAKEPLVLDLSGVTGFSAAGIWLLCVLDGDCRAAGVEWTLVESPPVNEILRDFDEVLSQLGATE